MGARRGILWNAIQLFPVTSHEREYDKRIALSCLRDLHCAYIECASAAFDHEYNARSVPLGHNSPIMILIMMTITILLLLILIMIAITMILLLRLQPMLIITGLRTGVWLFPSQLFI